MTVRYVVVVELIRNKEFRHTRYRHIRLERWCEAGQETIHTWRYLYVGKTRCSGFYRTFELAERTAAHLNTATGI